MLPLVLEHQEATVEKKELLIVWAVKEDQGGLVEVEQALLWQAQQARIAKNGH
jgi:hypothetical protein